VRGSETPSKATRAGPATNVSSWSVESIA
jgi:hypothetical protein